MEDVVDVLDQRDAGRVDLHLGPRLDEFVVAHLGEVVDVDRHVQVFGEGAGQGRLAGAGRAVEQPAALPRDALLQVPVLALAPQLDLADQVLDPLREDQVVERLAVVGAGLAELIGRVREQPIVALLVPRQAVAAAAGFVVARRRAAGRGGCTKRFLVAFSSSSTAQEMLLRAVAGLRARIVSTSSVPRTKVMRRIDLHRRCRTIRCSALAGRGLVLDLVGEEEREPAVPEDERAVAERPRRG